MSQVKNIEVISAIYNELHGQLTDWGGGTASIVPKNIEKSETDDVITLDLQLMSVEDFSAPIKMNEDIGEKIGHLVEKRLPGTDYMTVANGSAHITDTINIKMQGDGSGRYKINKVDGPLFAGDNISNYKISPTSISIGEYSQREFLTNFNVIKDHLSKEYNRYLKNSLTIEGYSINIVGLTELSDQDKNQLENVQRLISFYIYELIKTKDYFERVLAAPVTKQNTDQGHAIFYGDLYQTWQQQFDRLETDQTIQNIRMASSKIKNNMIRNTMLKTTGALTKDITDLAIMFEGLLSRYPELIKRAKEGKEMQEVHQTAVKQYIQLTHHLIRMVLGASEYFDTILEENK